MFDPNKPYNDLPALPPEGIDLEPKETLRLAIRANRALAELKSMTSRLPNPRILIQALSFQEAKGSSAIEGIVTTHDDLYKAIAQHMEATLDPHTKEVLRYQEAITLGVDWIKNGTPICTRLYESLVQKIKDNQSSVRKIPGTQLRNNQTDQVIYTPPEGEQVLRTKLANLDSFLNDQAASEVDPLIKMAVAHYQFEAIHPFHDGNGRVGRLVNILYLVQKNLLIDPTLYLSGYIFHNRTEYYRLLQGVTTDRAWQPWIHYMLNAVQTTAHETISEIQAIESCMSEFKQKMRETCRRAYSKELVDLLFEKPYCRIKDLVDKGLGTRLTVTRYLHDLEKNNLITELKIDRERIYINHHFLDVLRK